MHVTMFFTTAGKRAEHFIWKESRRRVEDRTTIRAGGGEEQKTCAHVCMCVYRYIYLYVYVRVCVCKRMCECVSVCECVCVCESGGVAGLCERDSRRRFAACSTGPVHSPLSIRPGKQVILRSACLLLRPFHHQRSTMKCVA